VAGADAGVDDGDVDVDVAAAVAGLGAGQLAVDPVMPVGSVWAKACTGRSGATAATFGSAFRAATRSEESVAL
jgi:hypothetical protein